MRRQLSHFRPVAAPIVGGLAGVLSLVLAASVATAQPSPGKGWAWGAGSSGQLGSGAAPAVSGTPAQIQGLTHAVSVAAGGSHSLAARIDGTAWAWGLNNEGQLGTGVKASSPAPVQVLGLTDVVKVAAGSAHSLALLADGTVWAWGANGFGQLGDGTKASRSVPVQVVGLTDVVAIAAGRDHSLAVKGDGTVWAWGANSSGQLGDGSSADRAVPVPVVGLSRAAAVAAGNAHSLALLEDGSVWAWGANGAGQLGEGTNAQRLGPVMVTGLLKVVTLAAGDAHSLALREDGSIWAWGLNGEGQLGDGSHAARAMPVQVVGVSNAVALAAGTGTSLAVLADGSVRSWGRTQGAATAETLSSAFATAVAGFTEPIAVIDSGEAHSIAVTATPPVIDPITSNLVVGASNTIAGSNFTAGSVLKLYVATGGGANSYGPYTPTAWTPTSLTWNIPASVVLGDGFGSVQVVNTDQGYTESNVEGALLVGDPNDNIPSILFVNGQPLAPVEPGIPVAHIDTVLAKGSTATIVGTGFNNALVNLYTAAGNAGPLVPLAGATSTQIQVQIPAGAATGPGNFQVVNNPYTGNVLSNAVSTVIGAQVTITNVSVNGSTITVTGTGFSTVSVINFFNLQGGLVVNLGGIGPSGPIIPLNITSDTQFTFTRPAGAVPGPAYVQVLNPPYIPFASSSNDPDGALTLP